MKLILVVTNSVGKIPHRHKWGHTLLLLSSDPTPHQTSTAVPLRAHKNPGPRTGNQRLVWWWPANLNPKNRVVHGRANRILSIFRKGAERNNTTNNSEKRGRILLLGSPQSVVRWF